jgi:methyl-CpG-binding domain protein 4
MSSVVVRDRLKYQPDQADAVALGLWALGRTRRGGEPIDRFSDDASRYREIRPRRPPGLDSGLQSPFGVDGEGLLQERPELVGTGGDRTAWRILILCILLNRSSQTQVLPTARALFRRHPHPHALATAAASDVAHDLASLGLVPTKAARLVALSRRWCSGDWRDATDLPGVGAGRYTADAWALFVEGRLDLDPTDAELRAWRDWARSAASAHV